MNAGKKAQCVRPAGRLKLFAPPGVRDALLSARDTEIQNPTSLQQIVAR